MRTPEECVEAITLTRRFVHELIAQKQQAPTDDPMSGLIAVREEDGVERFDTAWNDLLVSVAAKL